MQTLRTLEQCTSMSGTSMITIHMPNTDQNSINIMVNKLNHELGTASNIKSKVVRKNVISSLKRLIVSLSSYNNPCNENGLVLVAGIIDNKYCL